jgi:hypothetical protein
MRAAIEPLRETSVPRVRDRSCSYIEVVRFVRFSRQVDVALPGRRVDGVRHDVRELIRLLTEGPIGVSDAERQLECAKLLIRARSRPEAMQADLSRQS